MKVYFDGSPSKIAIVMDTHKQIFSNEVSAADRPLEIEYNALIRTLEILSENMEYILYSDNQSLVARMNCDHELPSSRFDNFHSKVQELIKKKELSLRVKWVPRKYNKAGKLI